MTCIHNPDEILKFQWKMFLKGFQIHRNYLCALKKVSRGLVNNERSSTFERARSSSTWYTYQMTGIAPNGDRGPAVMVWKGRSGHPASYVMPRTSHGSQLQQRAEFHRYFKRRLNIGDICNVYVLHAKGLVFPVPHTVRRKHLLSSELHQWCRGLIEFWCQCVSCIW